MILLHIFQAALLAVFGLPLLYLGFLTTAALKARRRHLADAAPPSRLRRFAIVVPAHNEELSIEKTVRSLRAIDYPRQRFDVIVAADNCTDDTARLARESGAMVWERHDSARRGKGYALRWCFDRILRGSLSASESAVAEPYEAIVVIDADTVVSGNYLAALNVAIEGGAEVMQTSDLVAPSPGSWTSEALRLSFVLYNYVRPLGRKTLGLSAGLRGNGMCFTCRALERVPWQAYSKAEDLEFGLQMLVAGYKTEFVPEATALATMPEQASNAESQRARWEGGRLPVIRHYALRLLGTAMRRRSFAAIDAFIDLATPAFVNMMAVSCALFVLSLGVWLSGGGFGLYVALWMICILAGVIHVAGGIRVAADPSLQRTLAAIPRYIAWKALLYVKLARRKSSDEWVRTTRERPADPPEKSETAPTHRENGLRHTKEEE